MLTIERKCSLATGPEAVSGKTFRSWKWENSSPKRSVISTSSGFRRVQSGRRMLLGSGSSQTSLSSSPIAKASSEARDLISSR